MQVISTENREEWLNERRKGIGGSDAAAIIGLSPYRGPHDVFSEKIGLAREQRDNPSMYWGRVLEYPIAQHWARENKKEFRDTSTFTIIRADFMFASPDRLLKGVDEGLEIKTAGWRVAHKWGDEGDRIPPEYIAQVQHYMAVTGYKRWHVASLIAGQDFRQYVIERDEEFIGMLVELERDFWNCVLSGDPPRLDGSQSARRYLDSAHPKNNGTLVELSSGSSAVAKIMRSYGWTKRAMKYLEGERDTYECKLIEAVGDDDGIVTPTGKFTYKAPENGYTDWKAIAQELNPSDELIAKHTKEPKRRVYFKPKTEDGHDGE